MHIQKSVPTHVAELSPRLLCRSHPHHQRRHCQPSSSFFSQTLLQTLHFFANPTYQRACLVVPEPAREPWMTGQVEGMGWNPRKRSGVDVLGRKSVGNLHSDILLDCGQGHRGSCSCIYSQALAYYLAYRKGSISLCWNELKLNFKFRGTLSKGWLPVTIAN